MNGLNRWLALICAAAAIIGLALLVPARMQSRDMARIVSSGRGNSRPLDARPDEHAMSGPMAVYSPAYSTKAEQEVKADSQFARTAGGTSSISGAPMYRHKMAAVDTSTPASGIELACGDQAST